MAVLKGLCLFHLLDSGVLPGCRLKKKNEDENEKNYP